jgi:hypothetical protein
MKAMQPMSQPAVPPAGGGAQVVAMPRAPHPPHAAVNDDALNLRKEKAS